MQIVLLTQMGCTRRTCVSASGGMRGRKGGGGSHFTWPLCIRRRRGKQAKVTSGRQVYTSCGWFVYVVWWWEQRVVDADSKEGISSSYSMCACVSVRAPVLAARAHPRTWTRSCVRTYSRRPPLGAGNEGIAPPRHAQRTSWRIRVGLKAQMKRSHCSQEIPLPRTLAHPSMKWSRHCSAGILMSFWCQGKKKLDQCKEQTKWPLLLS